MSLDEPKPGPSWDSQKCQSSQQMGGTIKDDRVSNNHFEPLMRLECNNDLEKNKGSISGPTTFTYYFMDPISAPKNDLEEDEMKLYLCNQEPSSI
jgi:hypothetical protein